jgi:hypothetical protein
MELMMYLGNDFIEAVKVNDQKISQPGYLGNFKRQLKMRYNELIQQTNTTPEFFIANMSTQSAKSN